MAQAKGAAVEELEARIRSLDAELHKAQELKRGPPSWRSSPLRPRLHRLERRLLRRGHLEDRHGERLDPAEAAQQRNLKIELTKLADEKEYRRTLALRAQPATVAQRRLGQEELAAVI